MLAHLGAMLAHLRAMLAHLGAMLAHLGAMLAHLEAYVGPSWGLCWPMLTHLKPQDPKNGKKLGRAQNTVKRDSFWRGGEVGGWGGGPSLLRRGENCRTARTRPGGPWPDFWADAPRRLRRTTRPSISSQWGRESYWMRTCFRNKYIP